MCFRERERAIDGIIQTDKEIGSEGEEDTHTTTDNTVLNTWPSVNGQNTI